MEPNHELAPAPASPPVVHGEHRPVRPSGPRRPSGSPLRRGLGPLIAALAAFLAKFKAVLLLLPKLKLLTTSGTMLVSVAAYALIWGWPFAVGFVVLLFVHEMGHAIQLRREGVKSSWPVFIPFMGAVITARSLGENALAEARVGLAGPVLGSIGSAACILIWQASGNSMWRGLAFVGFLLNLFNLIPLVPLDGGRAMAAMSPWMWIVGLVGVVALAIAFPNPVILIIAVLGGLDTFRRLRARRTNTPEQQSYYRVRAPDRALVGAVYLALVALLVVGMDATHLQRSIP